MAGVCNWAYLVLAEGPGIIQGSGRQLQEAHAVFMVHKDQLSNIYQALVRTITLK